MEDLKGFINESVPVIKIRRVFVKLLSVDQPRTEIQVLIAL